MDPGGPRIRRRPGRFRRGGGSALANQRSAEDDDLRQSLAGFVPAATSRLGLEELLTRVATYAVKAIPGADGAGLTLLEEDRADTLVATADFVSEIDDIQYSHRPGSLYHRGPRGSNGDVRRLWAATRAGGSSVARSPDSACTVCCRCR